MVRGPKEVNEVTKDLRRYGRIGRGVRYFCMSSVYYPAVSF